jgi:hypothetical protein
MGEKVRRGIKLEDGSYTYYYDKSPNPGSKSRQELINANKETKSGMKKKMSGAGRMSNIDRSFLNKDIKFEKPEPFNPKNAPEFKKPKPFNPNEMSEGKKYKYVGSSSIKKLKSGSKKKMPKARDMAMGNKNIVYLGDPYMVDGKMFDPVKAHPEDYLRPKGAKTYSEGGEINVGKGGDYIKDLID